MGLSSFSAFALTRAEMKNVVGGSLICTCSPKNSSGSKMSISYATSGSDCSSPTAGSAYFSFTKNGAKYAGYVDNSVAAGYCGWKPNKV